MDSLIWRNIVKAKSFILDGCYYSITAGDRVRIWDDPWVISPSPAIPRLREPIAKTEVFLRNLITADGCWNYTRLQELFDEQKKEDECHLFLRCSKAIPIWFSFLGCDMSLFLVTGIRIWFQQVMQGNLVFASEEVARDELPEIAEQL
ncbi:hypothetical protein Ancab_002399 [Ancistrocladus abbreviatus]